MSALRATSLLLLLVYWITIPQVTTARESIDKARFTEHYRYKRQLGDDSRPSIDLNSTVPYIFSARLYPYGEQKGDKVLRNDQEALGLLEPFVFLGDLYDTIYIRSDGAIGLSAVPQQPTTLPAQHPIMAAFWMPTREGKVYYRQTEDATVLNLAHNEVNIQYRYGRVFNIRSVVIVTWDGVKDPNNLDGEGNVFQMAILIGDEMTFAHLVYSKLKNNRDAVAGFSNGRNISFSLPDSGTPDAVQLGTKSDIGIPGEWLMRIDTPQVFLCGAGFKGLECVDNCSPSQWFNDCARSCHCENGDQCDPETGRCPSASCSPGWTGEPICDQDIDECERGSACPSEQPDCVNTPGAFLCLCFEYDEVAKKCKGIENVEESQSEIPVEVVPLRPQLHAVAIQESKTAPARNRAHPAATMATITEEPSTSRSTRPSPVPTPTRPAQVTRTTTTPEPTTPSVLRSKLIPHCKCASPLAWCVEGQCECLPGFTGNGQNCVDIDECEVNPTVCGEKAVCTNIEGSHECTCELGYRFDSGRCVDKNECLEGDVCGSGGGAECVNLEGSYTCKCADGYTGDVQEGCQDVDECALQGCGPNAVCTNTNGGFECECNEGFQRMTEDAFCTDIDECATTPCHPAAMCINLMGGFTCQCIEGFIGNGVQCHETILFPIANDSFVVPRSDNALATFHIESPITVFGKQYDTVHECPKSAKIDPDNGTWPNCLPENNSVSANGIVSFSPLEATVPEQPLTVKGPVIYALLSHYDYATEGLVAYTHINQSDAASYGLLTRSSLSMENQFKIKDFKTTDLHVFTFDRMRQAGTDNMNSLQVVIASSTPRTILTVLYERADAKGAIVGVANDGQFQPLPLEALTTSSNVGQPGKWMMQIDGPNIVACPAGSLNPPYCTQECAAGQWGSGCANKCRCKDGMPCDFSTGICVTGNCEAGYQGPSCNEDVDECAIGLVSCHANATCINTKGGFECRCRQGFIGDGTTCSMVARCESRYGRSCAANADCVDMNGDALCQCRTGYVGDGLTCHVLQTPTDEVADNSQNIAPHLQTVQEGVPHHGSIRPIPISDDERPFVMKEWNHSIVVPPTRNNGNDNINQANMFNTGRNPVSSVHPSKPTSDGYDPNHIRVEEGGHGNGKGADEQQEGDSEASTLLFIVVPSALCGVWLILVLVVIAVCCRNYKARQNHRRTKSTSTSTRWHGARPAPPQMYAPRMRQPYV